MFWLRAIKHECEWEIWTCSLIEAGRKPAISGLHGALRGQRASRGRRRRQEQWVTRVSRPDLGLPARLSLAARLPSEEQRPVCY